MRTPVAVTICLSLLAGAHIGSASAQGANAPLLTEAEIKPCEDLLTKSLALEIRRARADIQDYGPGGSKRERVSQDKANTQLRWAREKLEKYNGISILQFALKAPPYTPSYDTVKNVQDFIKEVTGWVAALESGSEERMSRTIGVPYRGQELEERLAWDKKFLCMLNVRLVQLKGGRPGAKPVAAKATQPAPKVAAVTGNAAPSNAPSAPNASTAGLSQQQIAACSEDIRRKQLESQSWPGDVNIVAARLGQFQKDLFEGRCAGHPEAQAYLAGANKMLGYGGNAPAGGSKAAATQGGASGDKESSSGKLAPLAPGMKSTEHNPMHNATNCIKIYHEEEMEALGLKSITRSMMVNTCPYRISVQWCVVANAKHAGDCNPGYSNLLNLSAKGTYGIHSDHQAVHYAACRYGENMGFQPVEMDPRQPFRFSCS